jgi:uncharacterized membrane protein YqaE (UPF0057 family)
MDRKILLIILSIVLPPLAVHLKTKAFGKEFVISVVLALFFWIPGVIYSLYLVTR